MITTLQDSLKIIQIQQRENYSWLGYRNNTSNFNISQWKFISAEAVNLKKQG